MSVPRPSFRRPPGRAPRRRARAFAPGCADDAVWAELRLPVALHVALAVEAARAEPEFGPASEHAADVLQRWVWAHLPRGARQLRLELDEPRSEVVARFRAAPTPGAVRAQTRRVYPPPAWSG